MALHEQLERALREHIRGGRLVAGVKLPSSRALAGQLGVSRGVVVEAYSQLTAEGYLLAGQGAPTRVAPTASAERPPVPAADLLASRRYDFDPDLPDLAGFPREQWLRSVRSAAIRQTLGAHIDPRRLNPSDRADAADHAFEQGAGSHQRALVRCPKSRERRPRSRRLGR